MAEGLGDVVANLLILAIVFAGATSFSTALSSADRG
jgi:hypothetical protein